MIRFHSLRWRLQSYYALLLFFALSILAALSIYWIRAIERHNADSQLREARHTLIPFIRSSENADPTLWKKFEVVESSNERTRGPSGMRGPGGPPGGRSGGPPLPSTDGVEELLERGWFFGSTAYDGTPLRLSQNFPDGLQFEVPTEERSGDRLVDSGEYRLLMHREPWGSVMIIGYSTAWSFADLWSGHWPIFVASLTLFIIVTSLGWLLIGRSLRPIQAIQTAAELVGAGELDARIESKSKAEDEVSRLSENLNQTFCRLEEMFERQKRFTAEASHELRTPIAVILGYCQIALDKDQSAEQVQDAIKACSRAGIRMKNLTNDLLELARLESGEIEFEFSKCEIRDFAEEALELIEPLAAEKGITLQDAISDATIMANSDRLWQVLVNLLNNAVRHTSAGRNITLKTLVNDSDIEIFVIDEGEGIPKEDLPNIFNRFYRVDSSRNRKTGGSGLGLAISETIIKAHGGSITVESQLNKGTTFRIRLPRK